MLTLSVPRLGFGRLNNCNYPIIDLFFSVKAQLSTKRTLLMLTTYGFLNSRSNTTCSFSRATIRFFINTKIIQPQKYNFYFKRLNNFWYFLVCIHIFIVSFAHYDQYTSLCGLARASSCLGIIRQGSMPCRIIGFACGMSRRVSVSVPQRYETVFIPASVRMDFTPHRDPMPSSAFVLPGIPPHPLLRSALRMPSRMAVT